MLPDSPALDRVGAILAAREAGIMNTASFKQEITLLSMEQLKQLVVRINLLLAPESAA